MSSYLGGVFAAIGFGVLFWLGFNAFPSIPNKWDRATAIGACGGMAILRLEDGSVWLIASSGRHYRIDDPDKLTCR